ncbi:MAG: hypothetical protein LBI18_02335 [Planctomycetaceae bacterium]|jgi:hypothetical protein|nr:hypothetical protein [Planctomycetaceae bacterium]
MDSEIDTKMVIANPIYDVVFKRLMDDTENARFFIETLLDQEVESIEFRPQEYPLAKEITETLEHLQLPGAMTFFRLDFLATIKTVSGEHQKVLIEVQKGKNTLDINRFREYLAEHYKRTDEIEIPGAGIQKVPLHIITIYILGFELEHISTPAVKIAREYIDLMTKQPITAKEDFAEQLTHDCIIIQTSRIHGPIQTELDALLSLFEQNYFVDDYHHFKSYPQSLENKKVRRMAMTLSYVAGSNETRKAMEVEESIRRIVEGYSNKEMQTIRYELHQTKQVVAEKDKVIIEKDQTIAEKDKQIAELLARLELS